MAKKAKDKTKYEKAAQLLLRLELMKRNITYDDLQRRLAAINIIDNKENIGQKVARGTFGAAFLLQCLRALNIRHIEVPANLFEEEG